MPIASADDLAADDSKRFLPSRKYVSAFGSRALFGGKGDDWAKLYVAYGLLSATASHAGPGAMVTHQLKGQRISGSPFASDEELRETWSPMFAIYKTIWRAFFEMLSGSGDKMVMEGIDIDFMGWWNRVRDPAHRSTTI